MKFQYSHTGDAGKRGNVTRREQIGVSTQNYAFDQGNRLASVSGTFSETYTYDGHGRRTTIQAGANPKKFQIYSQNGTLLQVGTTGAIGSERYLYLGAHLVAKVITGAGGTTTTRYVHTDGLGTPVAETDASGNLIAGSPSCTNLTALELWHARPRPRLHGPHLRRAVRPQLHATALP